MLVIKDIKFVRAISIELKDNLTKKISFMNML